MIKSEEQLDIIATAKALTAGQILKIDAWAGAAKAQPVYCKVQTPFGAKEIGSLVVGDEIFDTSGGIQKVVGVFPQGIKPTYRVTFRDGSLTECCDEHLWTVDNKGHSGRETKTLSLGEMLKLGIRRPRGDYRFRVPVSSPVRYPKKSLLIDPYLLGLLLGDGYICGVTPQLSVATAELDIVNYIGGLGGFITKGRLTSENCYQYSMIPEGKPYPNATNSLMSDLKSMGLDVKSCEKFIPQDYLESCVDDRLALLQGLMDADGCSSGNRISFCSTSKALIHSVKTLVQSLGGTCIKQADDTRGDRRPLYTLNIKTTFNPFKYSIKRHGWKLSNKNPPSRYITDVKYVGLTEQVCIKVSSPDCLYLTDEFIVTHNTSTLVMVAEELIENSICLVFNKSAQLEAVERFPDHVECRTTHSLAYQATGLTIQHKLSRPHGKYVNVLGTGNEIAKHFNLEPFELGDGQKPVTAALLGLFIRNTCNKYEQSRDKILTQEVLVQNVREYQGKNAKALRKLVMDKARELWKMRSDPSSSVLATHDTYLKMYQLSEPKLRYDVIYLDESQDSNDCVLDIVTKQNAKLILVGDSRQAIYCQPAGTMVKTIVDKVCKDVSIETLVEGDLVLAYDLEKHHLHKHGKPITKIGSRKFTGNLINISTDTLKTTYTEDHEAVVKLGHVNDEKYSHYLMRRNGKYRTGVVKWQSQMEGVFGVSHRASSERADAAWIIAIYDSWEEATIKEALFSYTYGIPDQCFNEKKTAWAELFWDEFRHCQTRLEQMWVDTGLLESKPLWCPAKGALTFRGAVVTSASNIRTGMLVCDLSSLPNTHGRIPLDCWKPVVSVAQEQVVDLEVYSMNVDKDHTYVGDGVLTHNCWRGAVNALDKVKENTITKRLTTTYRYGQESADIAAKILDSDVQIKSFEGLVTKVGDDVIDKSKPYTILYRTNEALVLDAVNSISQGNVVNLEIDTKDFCNLLDSSIALYRGEMGKVKHEDLVAFEDFEDLKDEAKSSASLTRIVNLIESNHCWKVLRTLRDHKNHPNPDIIYTTAHKSKGREWPQVQLANDFPSHYDREKKWVGLTVEEQNLLYVAATRAMKTLNINKTIGEIYIEQPRGSGLEINIKQISVLSAGTSKYEIAAIVDKHVSQDHRLQAYESFLDDDQNCDEYACDSFEGELNLLPDVSNMRFPI